MNDLYLYAIANAFVCMGIVFISICRINAMEDGTLRRVFFEYVGYLAGALASATQPWYGQWPQEGSLALSAALLGGLIASSHAWRSDVPPPCATDHAPLGEN
ncbi:MAG: hypothetical protein EOO22_13560 [Comamonadaceae bacterium]|nr:MAG: hypothetical protein EOO22_13560 [Comamonadaceae bacterium]